MPPKPALNIQIQLYVGTTIDSRYRERERRPDITARMATDRHCVAAATTIDVGSTLLRHHLITTVPHR